jgi:hypothetical protein
VFAAGRINRRVIETTVGRPSGFQHKYRRSLWMRLPNNRDSVGDMLDPCGCAQCRMPLRPNAERGNAPAIETVNRRRTSCPLLPEAALSEPEATDAGIDGEDGSSPGSR